MSKSQSFRIKIDYDNVRIVDKKIKDVNDIDFEVKKTLRLFKKKMGDG